MTAVSASPSKQNAVVAAASSYNLEITDNVVPCSEAQKSLRKRIAERTAPNILHHPAVPMIACLLACLIDLRYTSALLIFSDILTKPDTLSSISRYVYIYRNPTKKSAICFASTKISCSLSRSIGETNALQK